MLGEEREEEVAESSRLLSRARRAWPRRAGARMAEYTWRGILIWSRYGTGSDRPLRETSHALLKVGSFFANGSSARTETFPACWRSKLVATADPLHQALEEGFMRRHL